MFNFHQWNYTAKYTSAVSGHLPLLGKQICYVYYLSLVSPSNPCEKHPTSLIQQIKQDQPVPTLQSARYLTIFPCKRQSPWNINRSIIKNHRASLSVFYWGFAANREMYHLLILFPYPFSASIKKLMLFSISVWHTVPRHHQYFSKFQYYCI